MSATSPDDRVSAAFLGYLREALDDAALDYLQPPERILGSYDTAIYSFRLAHAQAGWSRPLILRVLRGETNAERARFEATTQSSLADQGYLVPRPLHVCEDKSVLGGAFLVMERIPGRPLLDFTSPVFFRMSTIMADWQAKLHDLDPAPLLGALAAADVNPQDYSLDARISNTADEIENARLDGLQPVMEWLHQHRPPDTTSPVICHDDFHPMNILVHKGEVTGIIDWSGIALAQPEYDVGVTTAIFSHGPVDLPGFAAPLVDLIRDRIVQRYRRRYEELRPLDAAAVGYFEALRSVSFLTEAGHRIQVTRGLAAPTDKPTAFSDPRQIRRIRKRVEEITGILPELPDR